MDAPIHSHAPAILFSKGNRDISTEIHWPNQR